MKAAAGCPGPSLPHKLEELQRSGRVGAPLFTAVPLSGRTPIESVLDEAAEMKSAVLLGFTRDGGHLVSYTSQPVAAADGTEGYALQLWRFEPGQRCRRLWSVPLFRTQPYLDAMADEEQFMPADGMVLTVAEAPDSGLLVVHGQSADPVDAASREHQHSYLTLIPGPLHAGAAQLHVVHLAYHTAYPHAPFNPYHALMPLEACGSSRGSSSGGKLAVALYSGDAVRVVHAAVQRQPAQAQPLLNHDATGDGEEDSSTSNFPSPDVEQAAGSPLAPAAAAAAGGGWPASELAGQRAPAQPPAAAPQAGTMQVQERDTPGSARRSAGSPLGAPWPRQRQRQPAPNRAAPVEGLEGELEVQYSLVSCAHAVSRGVQPTPPGGGSSSGGGATDSRSMAAVSISVAPDFLDLEACSYAALQRQGLLASDLLDYAAAPVQACSWQGRDGLLLLAVLRLRRPQPTGAMQQEGQQQPRQQPLRQDQQQRQQQQPQEPSRSACVLLHVAAASGAAAAAEWLEPPYPWHSDLSAYMVQQTAMAGLAFEKAPAFFAEFLRSRWAAPPFRPRLPLVLSNRSVLGSGRSLAHIAHSWLPQAILGYGSRGDGG